MLTPTRLFLGLAALCSLSLLTLLLSLDSNLALAYVSIAGYSIGGVGLCILVVTHEVYDLPPVLRLPTFRLPRLQLPALHFPKGSRIVLLGLAAVGTFFFLPPLVRLVYPTFGGFAPDTLNAYTLGAAQYFLALTMAYAGWRLLFPRLYEYAAETMEGKLLESITADLLALLPAKSPLHRFAASFGKSYDELQTAISDAVAGEFERLKAFGISISREGEDRFKILLPTESGKQTQVVGNAASGILAGINNIVTYHCLGLPSTNISLAEVAERRKIYTFQFFTRCARFIFCFLPFFIFFLAANAALTSALTAVPAAVPGL